MPELKALELENDALGVVVLPELGGKLTSLVSRATGREWLWRNPYLAYRAAAPGDSYVEQHDTGGIDECFPTVAPSAGFPDHGELWSQPWTVEAEETGRIALAARGVRSVYRFARALRLTEDGLELDYELESRSDRETSFVWCLHALFAIEPGMEIEAAGEILTRVPDPASPGFEPSATKRFVRSPADGEVVLRSADERESLRFRFDPAQVPFIGLWLNYRGWSGAGTAPYFNLGLEPSIGDHDSLEEAQRRGTAGTLGAGEHRRWWVALTHSRR